MAPSGVLVALQTLVLRKAHRLLKMLEGPHARVVELCHRNKFRVICGHVFSLLLQHAVFKSHYRFAAAKNMIEVGSICILLLALQLFAGV